MLRPFRRTGDGPPSEREERSVEPAPEPVGDGLKPSAMRGNEHIWGYAVAALLGVVAILNLVVTKGPQAPAHPDTALSAAGVAGAIALAGVVSTRNRMFAGMGAILASFLVYYPRVPTTLTIPHLLALVAPIAFGLIVTGRQRRLMTSQIKTARTRRADRPAGRAAGGGKRGKAPAPTTGPRPSARYTPPKPKKTSGRTGR